MAPLVYAAAAVVVDGYRFGTSDQSIHLTFLRRLLERGAMAGDLVADHAAAHPSLFWALQAPAVRGLGWDAIPALYLAAWLLALVANFAVLGAIARALLVERWAALLAPAALVVFKACPGHVRTFEPELINRTFAEPAVLVAVLLVLRERVWLAGFVLGLAFDVHATTAFHALLATGVAALVESRTRRRVPVMVLAFLVGASPLLWTIAHRSSGPFWVDAKWLHILKWRMPHHLFPARWPLGVWTAAVWQLALFAWGLGAARPELRPRVLGLAGGVGICAMLGTLAAGPLPLAPLMALHLWEAWLLLAVLAYLLAVGRLVQIGRRHPGAAVLASAFVLVGPEATWMGRPRRAELVWRGPTGDDAALVMALTGPLAQVEADRPIVVPPEGPDWLRPWTARPVYVTSKDGGEAVFDRRTAVEWRRRLARLCGTDVLAGPPPQGEWLGYRTVRVRAQAAFARQTAADLRALAQSEHLGLFVAPASNSYSGLPVVWRGANWVVYDLGR